MKIKPLFQKTILVVATSIMGFSAQGHTILKDYEKHSEKRHTECLHTDSKLKVLKKGQCTSYFAGDMDGATITIVWGKKEYQWFVSDGAEEMGEVKYLSPKYKQLTHEQAFAPEKGQVFECIKISKGKPGFICHRIAFPQDLGM